MNTTTSWKQAGRVLAFGAILSLGGCGSSGGGGGDGGSGALSLRITDGPVETAEHVYIQFRGVELHGPGGPHSLYYCEDPADSTLTVVSDAPCTTPPAPKQLDLLALTGGESDYLLNGFVLPAGHYNWARLMVDTDGLRDSYIVVMGGAEHELTIPSGSQTGLKVNRGFVVPAGGNADFTIDFDLRKSVHVTGTGEYMLRPTLRMVDNAMVGAIAGTVDAALVPGGCTPAVYVYTGGGVTPDDIDGAASEPVATAGVKLDISDGIYKYRAAFLEAGTYTVAYTCDAAADDPMTDDALGFSGTATIAVTAGSTTPHNF